MRSETSELRFFCGMKIELSVIDTTGHKAFCHRRLRKMGLGLICNGAESSWQQAKCVRVDPDGFVRG